MVQGKVGLGPPSTHRSTHAVRRLGAVPAPISRGCALCQGRTSNSNAKGNGNRYKGVWQAGHNEPLVVTWFIKPACFPCPNPTSSCTKSSLGLVHWFCSVLPKRGGRREPTPSGVASCPRRRDLTGRGLGCAALGVVVRGRSWPTRRHALRHRTAVGPAHAETDPGGRAARGLGDGGQPLRPLGGPARVAGRARPVVRAGHGRQRVRVGRFPPGPGAGALGGPVGGGLASA